MERQLRSGNFEKGQQVGQWTTYDRKGQVYKVTTIKPKLAASPIMLFRRKNVSIGEGLRHAFKSQQTSMSDWHSHQEDPQALESLHKTTQLRERS